MSVLEKWAPTATMLLLMVIGTGPHAGAQDTICVTTTQPGVTDPNLYSLQEAIYSAEFGTNTAIDATDPDSFHHRILRQIRAPARQHEMMPFPA